ncbi:MAG: thioredoxin [Lysobacteraceae bacterium]
MSPASSHVFDANARNFETEVMQRSLQTPVLLDFWAEWCGPCKTLGPMLEALAVEFGGAFLLAKVDVEAEQELGAAFQIRSIPTVVLVKDGQLVDGFQGALPDGQLREFLKHHGIEPVAVEAAVAEEAPPPAVDPLADVVRLREEIEAAPENDALKLDLAIALLRTGNAAEAERLLDALPANLSTDDRAIRARARLDFAALLRDAPPVETLLATLADNDGDLRARHLLGVHDIVAGRSQEGLEHFLEMLRRDRTFDEGLPRKALIDAFRIIEDEDLVGQYRRKMSSLLLV